jgi:hypothetical protein
MHTHLLADSLGRPLEQRRVLGTGELALAELERHADQVSRHIVLHDPSEWPGVFEAVIIFLHNNREWHIIEHCNRGSGLLVLERYND